MYAHDNHHQTFAFPPSSALFVYPTVSTTYTPSTAYLQHSYPAYNISYNPPYFEDEHVPTSSTSSLASALVVPEPEPEPEAQRVSSEPASAASDPSERPDPNAPVAAKVASTSRDMRNTGYGGISDKDVMLPGNAASSKPNRGFLETSYRTHQHSHTLPPQSQSQSQSHFHPQHEHQPQPQAVFPPHLHTLPQDAVGPSALQHSWPPSADTQDAFGTFGHAAFGGASALPSFFPAPPDAASTYFGFDESAGVYGAWADPTVFSAPAGPSGGVSVGLNLDNGFGVGVGDAFGFPGGTWAQPYQGFGEQHQQTQTHHVMSPPAPPIGAIGSTHDRHSATNAASGHGARSASVTEGRVRDRDRLQYASVGHGTGAVAGVNPSASVYARGEYLGNAHPQMEQQLHRQELGEAFGYRYPQISQQQPQQHQGQQMYALPSSVDETRGMRFAESEGAGGRRDDVFACPAQPPTTTAPSQPRPSTPHPFHAHPNTVHSAAPLPTEVQSEAQTIVPSQQQHTQHSAIMAPPPLPIRLRGHIRSKPRHSAKSPVLQLQQTVVGPPDPKSLEIAAPQSSSATTVPPSPSEASAASVPAAPQPSASSQSSAKAAAAPATAAEPREFIARMNELQWGQAQQLNRFALNETFRLRHGRNPPREMHILETSALERSIVGEALRAVVRRENAERAEREVAGEGEAGDGRRGGEPTAPEDMSDEEFFRRGPDSSWVPARSGAELELEAALEASGMDLGVVHAHGVPMVSPVSPDSPDEITTPRDAFSSAHPTVSEFPHGHPYAHPAGTTSPMHSAFIAQKVLPLLRPDGHLAPHVSGLGGACSEAYDGRSYLPDEAEPDENHVPRAPPGARIGDHPTLSGLRPHPLALRGERWHALVNPAPPAPATQMEGGGNEAVEENEDEDPDRGERPSTAMKQRAEDGVKDEEKGQGWGFVEGGSHGPLPPLDGVACGSTGTSGQGSGQGPRLKLSTDKKAPPKMACLFCRNRKIACGIGKGDDKTCNQCARRKLRCVFPTESRRGMRTRKPRSAHTVDGIDEAVKDTTEAAEPDPEDPAANPSSSSAAGPSGLRSKTKTAKSKEPREKGKKPKAKGKGKGKGKALQEEEEPVERVDNDVEMGDGAGEGACESSTMQVDQNQDYADDPLASLAAEMQHQQSGTQSSPPSSSMTLMSSHFTSGNLTPQGTDASALAFHPSFNSPLSTSAPGSNFASSTQMTAPMRASLTMSPLHMRKQGQGNSDTRGR